MPNATQPDFPEAVVFDFDGTLADSYEAITASVNHVRGLYHMQPLKVSQVRPCVGRGAGYLLAHTLPGLDPTKALAEYKAHHPSVLRSGTRLLPGVAATLAELSSSGFKLGVCSNKPKPFTSTLLDILDIARFFKAVIGPEDAPKPKPAPDMLIAALDALGVSAARALYVGDMTVDIETARAAGARVWVIATGSDGHEALAAAHPDRLLGNFRELAGLVRGEWKGVRDQGSASP
jgi:phosphoglycolate phosphatase